MSKRKNRSKASNLPEEVLARARQQAASEAQPEADDPAAPVEPVKVAKSEKPTGNAAPRERADNPRENRRRRELRQAEYQARERRGASYDSVTLADLLAHPTKIVTEAELHEQYGYVLADLRSMGILAAVLFVALVLIAQFIG